MTENVLVLKLGNNLLAAELVGLPLTFRGVKVGEIVKAYDYKGGVEVEARIDYQPILDQFKERVWEKGKE